MSDQNPALVLRDSYTAKYPGDYDADTFALTDMAEDMVSLRQRIAELEAESMDRAEAWGDVVIERDRLREALRKILDCDPDAPQWMDAEDGEMCGRRRRGGRR